MEKEDEHFLPDIMEVSDREDITERLKGEIASKALPLGLSSDGTVFGQFDLSYGSFPVKEKVIPFFPDAILLDKGARDGVRKYVAVTWQDTFTVTFAATSNKYDPNLGEVLSKDLKRVLFLCLNLYVPQSPSFDTALAESERPFGGDVTIYFNVHHGQVTWLASPVVFGFVSNQEG